MDDAPLFRITRGIPTAEELAALVGVVISRSRPVASPPAPPTSVWSRSARPGAVSRSGMPAHPGPGAWRASALPR